MNENTAKYAIRATIVAIVLLAVISGALGLTNGDLTLLFEFIGE